VKTLVQDEVQREKVTFFTARTPAVSWANFPRPALGEPMCNASLALNANFLTDGTICCRTINGTNARTTSTELMQLATCEKQTFEEATTTDGDREERECRNGRP
jgi:hypothetical protein